MALSSDVTDIQDVFTTDDYMPVTEIWSASQGNEQLKLLRIIIISRILLLCCGITVFVMNFLVILVIKKWTAVKSSMRALFTHLAVGHMLFGAAAVLKVATDFLRFNSSLACRLLLGLVSWSGRCSSSINLLLALHVTWSARNILNVNNREISTFGIHIVALVAWFSWGCIFAWGVIDDQDGSQQHHCFFAAGYYKTSYHIVVSVVLLIHASFVLICHSATFLITWRQTRQLETRVAPRGEGQEAQTGQDMAATHMSCVTKLRVLRKMYKITMLVSFMHLITTVPYLIVVLIDLISTSVEIDPTFLMFLVLLTFVYPNANIFIYSARSTSFRKHLVNMLRCRSLVHPDENIN